MKKIIIIFVLLAVLGWAEGPEGRRRRGTGGGRGVPGGPRLEAREGTVWDGDAKYFRRRLRCRGCRLQDRQGDPSRGRSHGEPDQGCLERFPGQRAQG